MEPLSKEKMLAAFTRLDELLTQELVLIVGGGCSMVLAHGFPLATTDIDAIPKGIEFYQLEPLIKQIATEQNLPHDWLNPYFATFSYTLPSDYGDRLIPIFPGQHLQANALGPEEMLIMKCFAHRQKDVPHARALIKKGTNLKFVEKHLELLLKQKIPGTQEALDFLDDCLDL